MAVALAGLPVEVTAAAIQPAAVLQDILNLRGDLRGRMRGPAIEGHGKAIQGGGGGDERWGDGHFASRHRRHTSTR